MAAAFVRHSHGSSALSPSTPRHSLAEFQEVGRFRHCDLSVQGHKGLAIVWKSSLWSGGIERFALRGAVERFERFEHAIWVVSFLKSQRKKLLRNSLGDPKRVIYVSTPDR